MQGDFTRFAHRKHKHYNAVLAQQGRVQTDSDKNEAVDLLKHIRRTTAVDVIGHCGVPAGDSGGFEVRPDSTGKDLEITKGRAYVGGILLENEADVLYSAQQHYPLPQRQPLAAGRYFATIEVWERLVTALNDPDMLEVALGGPDTTVRTQTVWQVKLDKTTSRVRSCADWKAPALPTGRLAFATKADATSPGPCEVPSATGYRGLENRCYRVEVHEAGANPLFKWSRHNASMAFRITGSGSGEVTLEHHREEALDVLLPDTWLELVTEEQALRGEPGKFVKVGKRKVGGVFQVTPGSALPKDGIARLWEGGEAVQAPVGTWVEMEAGVHFRVDGGTFRSGDWWARPARTLAPEGDWRDTTQSPQFEPAGGIERRYCPLALVELDASGNWHQLDDCRRLFPPLTALPSVPNPPATTGCCLTVAPTDDLQGAINKVIARGGGCVCLTEGVHEHTGPIEIIGARGLQIHGQGRSTVLRLSPGRARFGLHLLDSRGVEVSDLVVLGMGLDAALVARGPSRMPGCEDITLRSVEIINTRGSAAWLHASSVTITDSFFFGKQGIQWAEQDHPSPEIPRLRHIDLVRCEVRFMTQGMLLNAEDATLADCRIVPVDPGLLDGRRLLALAASVRSEDGYKALDGIHQTLAPEPASLAGSGWALIAPTLTRSELVRCELAGDVGLESDVFDRTTLTDCTIRAAELGVRVRAAVGAGLRTSSIDSGGIGVQLGSSASTELSCNEIRGRYGVRVEPVGPWIEPSPPDGDVRHGQPILRATAALQALARALGVADLLDPLSAGRNSTWAQALARAILTEAVGRRAGAAYPLFCDRLCIEGNRVDAGADGIQVLDLLPYGSVVARANDVRAGGAGVRMEAANGLEDVDEVLFVLTNGLADLVRALAAPFGAAVEKNLLDWLARRGPRLSERPEHLIDSNHVVCTQVGIASNLHGVEVCDNHVVLRSDVDVAPRMARMLAALDATDASRPVAYGLRTGSASMVERALRSIGAADAVARTAASAAVDTAAALMTRGAADNPFTETMAVADDTLARERMTELARSFAEEVGSYGIRMAGPGSLVRDNRVEADAELGQERWPRGGIAFLEDSAGGQTAFSDLWAALVKDLQRRAPRKAQTRPTVVDRNVVQRGFGHGIHMGLTDRGREERGVELLQVLRNDVRSMGGAGILIDEESHAVDVRVEENEVAHCSGVRELAGLHEVAGGIHLGSAAMCRVRANVVHDCLVEGDRDIWAAGIRVSQVFGLQLVDNRVSKSGSGRRGAVDLVGVYGDVSIEQNRITEPVGWALGWGNGGLKPPGVVMDRLRKYREGVLDLDLERTLGSVCMNQIEFGERTVRPGMSITGVPFHSICSNQVRYLGRADELIHVRAGAGPIVGNLVLGKDIQHTRTSATVFAIQYTTGGTVTSNVGKIHLHAPGAAYQVGLNQPKPTVTL